MRSISGLNPLVAACLVSFFVGLGTSMLRPVTSLYAQDLGASVAQVGLIQSASITSVSALLLGLVSDKFGRKKMVFTGSSIMIASNFFLVFTTAWPQILFTTALTGLGTAIYSPAIFAFVGDVSRSDHYGSSYGWYTTFMFMSSFVGLLVGGAIASLIGFRNLFIVSGLIGVVGVILVGLLFPKDSIGVKERTRKFHAAQSFKMVFGNKLLIVCGVAVLNLTFMFGAGTFLPLYIDSIGLGVFVISILQATQSGANALARLPFGKLSDRLRTRLPFIASGLITTAVATALLASFTNVGIIMLLMGLLGLAYGVTVTSTTALLTEASSIEFRGFVMGFYTTMVYLGMAVGPGLIGSTISLFGFQLGFSITGSLGLVGTLIVYIISKM